MRQMLGTHSDLQLGAAMWVPGVFLWILCGVGLSQLVRIELVTKQESRL